MVHESGDAFDPHEPLRHPKPVVGSAEVKTRGVVVLTLVTAVGEVAYGTWTRSMALVADGWHMATHVGALAIAAVAYWYARTLATRDRFSFGPGKIYALAGFTNAVLLVFAALWLVVESVARMIRPEPIDFSQAIPVAVIGLVVNLVSAALLHGDHEHGHDHGHDHGHPSGAAERTHAKAKNSPLTHDHNLQAAYLHVLADALTSLLAIVALVAGCRTGFTLLDPLMGVVGAVVIARWAWQLLARAARPLLDMVPASVDLVHLREVLEEASAGEVVDMHVWEMGPNEVCCVVALAAHKAVDIETCRRIVVRETAVDHLTIELRPCAGEHPSPRPSSRELHAHHKHRAHGHDDHESDRRAAR